MNAAARSSIGRSIAIRSMLEPSCTPWQLVWSSMYCASLGIDDRGAVREQDDVGLDLAGDGEVVLAPRGGVFARRAAGVAGRAARGDAGVEDEDVGRRLAASAARVSSSLKA